MSEIPDSVIEKAARIVERTAHRQTCAVFGYAAAGEPMRGPDGQVMWSLKVGMSAGAEVIASWAREQERARIKAEVERILADEHGLITAGPPVEWGPKCAGCGDDEYRIDGFCTIECRDRSDMAFDVLAALDRDGSADTREDGK